MRLEPLGNPPSHWTIAAADNWFVGALLVATLFHFWFATVIPPSEDELYYWTWAKHLQLSYFDHPPMVAYLIALSTKIFGDNLFGIRFFACLSAIFILAALRFLCSKNQIVGFLLLSPLFLYGACLMTPDAPLLFFWTAYTLWLIQLNRTFCNWNEDPVTRVYRAQPISASRWFLGGLLLGLGLLSKYSMVLAIPCAFLVLLSKYRFRAWAVGFLFHLGIAAIVCIPVIIYNMRHGFAPFIFQWNHAVSSYGYSFGRFTEFWGTQALLLGALPFLMLPWVLLRGREMSSDPKLHVCFYFFVIPLIFFFFQTAKSYVEANWTLLAYIGFWPMAQRMLDRSSFRRESKALVLVSFIPALVCSALLLVHFVKPLRILPPQRDRISRLSGQYKLSQRLAHDLREDLRTQTETSVLLLPTYQWTSYLKFQKIPADQMPNQTRISHFTIQPKDMCAPSSLLFFSESAKGPELLERCFPKKQILKEYPLIVRGEEVQKYTLVQYSR